MALRARIPLWALPLATALLLAAAGLWLRDHLERSLEQRLEQTLRTLLDADVTALELWLDGQERAAETLIQDPALRALALALIERGERDGASADALRAAREQALLREHFGMSVSAYGWSDFMLAGAGGRIVAAGIDAPIGFELAPEYAPFTARVLAGETLVSKPMWFPPPSVGHVEPGLPRAAAMWAATPVRDETGVVLGALAFRIAPERDFTRILQVARLGETGETFAFDESGTLLTASRLEDELRRLGLLPAGTGSVLMLRLADPGRDLREPGGAAAPGASLPLTRMAAAAVAGQPGVDVDGYRDVRGVEVVGAWRWLPRHGFGVAFEADATEAYRAEVVLRRGFAAATALLLAAAGGIALSSRVVYGLQRSERRARRIGQYTLLEKLGEGGMGAVYRVRHALLRRPTALKLIRPDQVSAATVARFECEVQLTAELTHPCTIAIYDYGRTPDGVFYYAMEYLDGITLERLVRSDGPQPERRVVHLLEQICGSLAEAHAKELIHRDVKPANLMLCQRGGLCDVVKVLDFGLVKDLDAPGGVALTAAQTITGTPATLAPEAILHPEAVDERSDVYSIGAVAYALLTGEDVFPGEGAVEVMGKHLHVEPEPPSKRLGRAIDAELESLVLRCLAKSPDGRPCGAQALVAELDGVRARVGEWTAAEASGWWRARGDAIRRAAAPARRGSTDPTVQIDWEARLRSGGAPAGA
jgi:hypothetical protein